MVLLFRRLNFFGSSCAVQWLFLFWWTSLLSVVLNGPFFLYAYQLGLLVEVFVLFGEGLLWMVGFVFGGRLCWGCSFDARLQFQILWC